MRAYVMGVLALALLYGLIVAAASGIDSAIGNYGQAQTISQESY
jgi:hypothetical protein